MKQIRLSAAAVALAALFATAASAQAPAAARPAAAAPATQPAGAAATGPARIAVIDSRYFRGTDEKGTGGISRYITAAKQLEAQFQPRVTELRGIETRVGAIAENIKKTAAVAKPEDIERQRAEGEKLEVDLKRKSEDLQRDVEAAQDRMMRPIEQDVFTAIQAFAQQRGYSIVIDIARVPVIYAADQLDITREFIAEFNRRPATASSAAPGTRP